MSKINLLHAPCPSCPSSDAYCEYEDGHGYCFSCGYFKPSKEDFISTSFTYEYLPWRKVTEDTFRFYDVKTKVTSEGKPITIGFKYPDGSYKVRSLEDKKFWTEGTSKPGLFGRDKFAAGSHKFVTITEGELDACSLYQVLKTPVVSVHSAGSGLRDCAAEAEWLAGFERIYLAFDGDSAGREALRAVARLFSPSKVFHVRFTNRKDPNEYLSHGEESDLRNLWWNSKKYLPETVISSLEDFKKILEEPSRPSISYPFPTLNLMTGGIRTGESVLLTAQEGVGKTEIMHAIEHHLLKESQDGVAAIFLEEPKKDHLRSIARYTMGRPVHLANDPVSDSEIFTAVKRAVPTDDRLFLYNHFGSDSPEVLLDTIRFLVSACGVRHVLLDHLSMAVSGLSGEDERKALDHICTQLEMMVVELDFSLIMVSHVNDLGQTRGSRMASKVANIRIDAQRDITASDDRIKRQLVLTISKNRPPGGLTGAAGILTLDPTTYTLVEMGHEEQHSSKHLGVEASVPVWREEQKEENKENLVAANDNGSLEGEEKAAA